ncbi:MAG: DUF4426 domain-containing protein [Gammaproteobacteria bacterium]|nr:DUF4426 domain-containing protein [Gammaproteobacteria bacterium]MCP4091060.1 DUF4426 domain-containing protein [Gammaproteobacteria bacterium]MCP4277414.1 DUF4426 domain-containing protein [Gammaproteobacteria bacterium]MCP4831525.1 DUF4426 domain-containing protein [Gammaproteobacteria bacterium]MCP4927748.1 DUF4426 domain-containing protein [Gammaproteobacteria bacterium]
MKRISVSVSVAVMLFAVTACDSGTGLSGAEEDGRTRLSVRDGYGEFGEYMVRINAMTTTSLTPEVAKSYGIVRSANSGLVNLVILKKSSDTAMDIPITGDVEVSATNLTGQMKSVKLREIVEGESVYYLAQVSIDDRETVHFDFDIRPADSNKNLPVRFSYQFYTR